MALNFRFGFLRSRFPLSNIHLPSFAELRNPKMEAILLPEPLAVVGSCPALASRSASFTHQIPCLLLFHSGRKLPMSFAVGSRYERISGLRRSSTLAAAGTLTANSVPVCYLTLSDSLSICSSKLNAFQTEGLYGCGTDIFYSILFYIFEVFLFTVLLS